MTTRIAITAAANVITHSGFIGGVLIGVVVGIVQDTIIRLL